MQVTPIGALALLLWFVFASRGIQWALYYTVCLIPFGMAAAVNMPALGNLSILILQMCAGLTVGMVFVGVISGRIPFDWSRLPFSFRVMAILLGYGVISALFFPRLFQRAAMVFSLGRGDAGVRLAPQFHSTLVALRPTTGNISQTFYFSLSAFVFYCIYLCSRKPGTGRYLHLALGIAALINGILAALDIAKLTAVLQFVRTANYALLDDVSVAGLPRVIGGFPEASAFGAVSSVFAAYFLVHFQNSRETRSAFIAIVSVACSAASFSSTGIFGLFVLGAYTSITTAIDSMKRLRQNRTTALIVACTAGLFGIFLLLMVTTSLDQKVFHLLDKLIFEKGTSVSGIERGAWAEYGYKAFISTWGAGAGLGSLRSSGLVPTMLGSIGLPGFLLLLAFLGFVILKPMVAISESSELSPRSAVFRAARAGMVVSLGTSFASATVPDLGILFMLLAALAEQARGVPIYAAVRPIPRLVNA